MLSNIARIHYMSFSLINSFLSNIAFQLSVLHLFNVIHLTFEAMYFAFLNKICSVLKVDVIEGSKQTVFAD